MLGRAEAERSGARLLSSRDVRDGGAWTPRQKLKNDLIYGLVRLLLGLALGLPRNMVRAACLALGCFGYVVLRKQRAAVRLRLEVGLGKMPGPLVARTFVTAAELVADTIDLLRPDERAGSRLFLDDASRRVFADALAEGRGVVFVAAHLGPWERMAAMLAEQGFPVTTVARESYDPRLTEIYERIRRPRGVRSLYRGRPRALLAMARELSAGRAVGFLVDLPTRVPSIECRLFGDQALIPVGPGRLAMARRAAVVVGTCVPGAEGIAAGPAVRITRISTQDLKNDVSGEEELVKRITEELSRRIVAWPEAWLGTFVPPRLRVASDPR